MSMKTPLKVGDFIEIEDCPLAGYVGKIARVAAINPGWDNPYQVAVGPWNVVCPRNYLSNALAPEELAKRLNAAIETIEGLEADIARLEADIEPGATFRP